MIQSCLLPVDWQNSRYHSHHSVKPVFRGPDSWVPLFCDLIRTTSLQNNGNIHIRFVFWLFNCSFASISPLPSPSWSMETGILQTIFLLWQIISYWILLTQVPTERLEGRGKRKDLLLLLNVPINVLFTVILHPTPSNLPTFHYFFQLSPNQPHGNPQRPSGQWPKSKVGVPTSNKPRPKSLTHTDRLSLIS